MVEFEVGETYDVSIKTWIDDVKLVEIVKDKDETITHYVFDTGAKGAHGRPSLRRLPAHRVVGFIKK